MSGPYGNDPTAPWGSNEGQHQAPGGDNPTEHGSGWQQPAYQPPSAQYPSHGQQPEQFGQQPTQYGQPNPYAQSAQPTQYGQPTDYLGQQAQPTQYGQPTEYLGQQQPGQYPPQPDQFGQQPGGYPPQPDQFGQYGQQPGQYGQFGQQPGAPGGSKKSSGMIIGIVAALVAVILVVVGILGFVAPGFFVTTELDVTKAQSGVQTVLTDEDKGYGAKNVKDVKCNSGKNPQVKKGDTFTCEVSIDGTKRQVTVTFQNDDGTYEVGRPK